MLLDKSDESDDGDAGRSVNRVFAGVILLCAAGGLYLAMWADTSPRNNDALREVGGALVSGAVLAGLVVWYEGNRERRLIRRENAREDRLIRREENRAVEAFKATWQREVFLKLFALQAELETTRRKWITGRRKRLDRIKGRGPLAPEPLPHGSARTFQQVQDDVAILLAFLRAPELTSSWDAWLEPRYDLDEDTTNDIDEIESDLKAEWEAWGGWVKAVRTHLETHYDVDSSPDDDAGCPISTGS